MPEMTTQDSEMLETVSNACFNHAFQTSVSNKRLNRAFQQSVG